MPMVITGRARVRSEEPLRPRLRHLRALDLQIELVDERTRTSLLDPRDRLLDSLLQRDLRLVVEELPRLIRRAVRELHLARARRLEDRIEGRPDRRGDHL